MINKQLYLSHIIPINKCSRNEENRKFKLKCYNNNNNYSMMNDKISGQNFKEKQDICIASKYLSQIFVNYYKLFATPFLEWRA